MFSLKLDCGHPAYTDVELRMQYPTDSHLILCLPCREAKNKGEFVPTAWRNVTSVSEHNDPLYDVLNGDEIILPNRIMRLQPSVPKSRVRPFPYLSGVRR